MDHLNHQKYLKGNYCCIAHNVLGGVYVYYVVNQMSMIQKMKAQMFLKKLRCLHYPQVCSIWEDKYFIFIIDTQIICS